jgi:type 1 fimbria pilin
MKFTLMNKTVYGYIMNKKFISLALGMLFSAAAISNASAATVNFKGSLTSSVCVIDINNTGAETGNVDLGTVNADEMSTIGATSEAVSFNVAMKSCPTGYSNYRIQFDGVEDASSGDFAIVGSIDDGLVIQLKDANGSKVSPNTPVDIPTPSGRNGELSVPFTASIVSTRGTAGSGSFSMTSNISVKYD